MNKFIGLIIVLLFSPVFAHAEYIDTFESQIEVKKDGSFSVTETIDYRFTEERHGIFREIPLIHPEKPSAIYKERIIDIEPVRVLMDGKDVPYVLESTSDLFKIRIGDPDATLTGQHLYTIEYIVRGGLSYPQGEGVELYWNVTGNEWPIPIRVAEARIQSEPGLFRIVRSCYRGTFGSTSGSCQVVVHDDDHISFRTTELNPQEGMTIAQSLTVSQITKDVRERTNFLWMLLPIGLLTIIYGGFRMYRYVTANATGAPIIPQYEPYPGTKPMYAGLLSDGKLDPRDITACIVYLAKEGYLKIRKTDRKVLFFLEVDDYEIVFVKAPDETLGGFERRVLDILFSESPVGTIVTLSALKKDQSEREANYKEVKALQEDLKKDLIAGGFYESLPIQRLFTISACIVGIGSLALFVFDVFNPASFWAIAAASIVAAVLLHRRRTRKGYEALDHLKGFELFLEMTDRDRFAFHNAPQKSPEQFMEFLPYAIAFGVEKEWARVFDGMAMANPEWYEGGGQTFSSSNLTSSLGAFSSAFTASSGASPAGGGGSSGGGAGGGGGGSW
jgi:hypothetical protein